MTVNANIQNLVATLGAIYRQGSQTLEAIKSNRRFKVHADFSETWALAQSRIIRAGDAIRKQHRERPFESRAQIRTIYRAEMEALEASDRAAWKGLKSETRIQ